MALALALTRTMLSLPHRADTAKDFGRAVRVAIRAASLSNKIFLSLLLIARQFPWPDHKRPTFFWDCTGKEETLTEHAFFNM